MHTPQYPGGRPRGGISHWPSGDTMFLESRGLATDPATGCITGGQPGHSAGGPLVPALAR